MYCWFLQIPGSVRSNVEEKNCVIVVDGYVSLSIATGFTAFIYLMSVIMVHTSTRQKRIMLPLESGEKDSLADGTLEGAVGDQ